MKEQLDAVGGYPALCVATFPTWYRCAQRYACSSAPIAFSCLQSNWRPLQNLSERLLFITDPPTATQIRRVVLEQVVAFTEQLASQALAFIAAGPAGEDSGAARARAGGKKGAAAAATQLAECNEEEVGLGASTNPACTLMHVSHLTQTPLFQNQPYQIKPPQVEAVIARFQRVARAFAALIELSKVHQNRVGLLGQVRWGGRSGGVGSAACDSASLPASHCRTKPHSPHRKPPNPPKAIKLGAKYIDAVLRALPFWRATYDGRGEAFVAVVRDAQRGTKLMQNICNESKVKRSAQLLSKAPGAKKSLERFVFEVGAGGGWGVGRAVCIRRWLWVGEAAGCMSAPLVT
jgi:hypothetical protein